MDPSICCRRISSAFAAELFGNLRVQNPQLPVERCGFVYGEWRTPRHFRHQIDVVVGLLQQRANFISERGFPHAVGTDQRKFQGPGYLEGVLLTHRLYARQPQTPSTKLNLWISAGSG